MRHTIIVVGELIKSFKYRVYCSKETARRAEYQLELTRQLYNAALEQRIISWKQHRKSISRFDQQAELPSVKSEIIEYKFLGSHVLQEVIHRLDLAYLAFFKKIKEGKTTGFPRFKAKNRWDSIIFPDIRGWKLTGNFLKVKTIGTFKLKLSRSLEGEQRTLILKKDGKGRWYASICCREVTKKLQQKTNKSVGIDVGLKSFLTLSDGAKVENPRHFKNSQEELRIAQQSLARKKKGSKRRLLAKTKVITIHEKIKNQRLDFHFKLALLLVKTYDLLAVENIKPSKMISNKNLNRSMNDAGWSQFLNILSFKAVEAGKEVIRVSPAYTSRTCSGCGHVKEELPLSMRAYECEDCGMKMDRDHNAAINILARAGPTIGSLPLTTPIENVPTIWSNNAKKTA